jgi:hypothetical protein
MALQSTLTGPRPVLAPMMDDAVTILRSDQFIVGPSAVAGVALRDETGKPTDFPLLMVQPTLANRAAPPNGVGIRSIEGDLVLSSAGRTLFRSEYIWYRMTSSFSEPDDANKADRLIFESAAQIAPFDLPGGGTWSHELLLIPRETWAAVSWAAFDERVSQGCSQHCQGELTLRVRLDNGTLLTEPCTFSIDKNVLAHLRGTERRYFTSPECFSRIHG